MLVRPPPPPRGSFARKAVAALLLVGLAQWLFYGQGLGATLGGVVLVWCATLAVSVPRLRRGASAVMLAAAALLASVMIEDPSLLGWVLCWTAVASAALLPRRAFDDAGSWTMRLVTLGLSGVVTPVRDAARLVRNRGAGGVSVGSVATVLALPLFGAGLFLMLFAIANPVIAAALNALRLPSIWDMVFHLLFWGAVLAIVWPTLRPKAARLSGGLIWETSRPLDRALGLVTLFMFATSTSNALVPTMLQDLTPASLRARSFALWSFVVSIFCALGPLAAGLVSDHLLNGHLLSAIAVVACGSLVGSILCAIVASRSAYLPKL